MNWTVREATNEDITSVASRLRDSDRREIIASSGKDPTKRLLEATQLPSLGIWVGEINDNPEVLFGVVNIPGSPIGSPWMVCTDEPVKNLRGFLDVCQEWVDHFSKQYPLLINYVHAENKTHIRWLKWVGFKFIKLHPKHGAAQEPFWEFRMKRK